MIRIVKMQFEEVYIDAFQSLFQERKERIASFTGCSRVELLQDKHNPCIFFTYSFWDDEAALNAYRDSDFFKETWQLTKAMFAEKASAWSVERLYSSE